uniref:Streptothricin acetyltransferase n=1 Tax=Streptomyces rochei TaxID=1928 RepID=A0A0U3TX26_STRRO|nr:streptothricin acetyltransferase [Streptomyces rochei]
MDRRCVDVGDLQPEVPGAPLAGELRREPHQRAPDPVPPVLRGDLDVLDGQPAVPAGVRDDHEARQVAVVPVRDERPGVRVAVLPVVRFVVRFVVGEHLGQGRVHRHLPQGEAVPGGGDAEDGVGGEGPVQCLDGLGVPRDTGAVPVSRVVKSGHGATLRPP